MKDLCRNLAAAARMLVDAGILGYSGHLSTRAGDGQTLLIQPVDDARRTESRPPRQEALDLLHDGGGVRRAAARRLAGRLCHDLMTVRARTHVSGPTP